MQARLDEIHPVGSIDRTETEWFRTAVFYEVLVRSFKDSNGDGIGDFKGLTGKLDYLQWLGVDCLWLPPFYDSPLHDGGYDIRDYRWIREELGTIEDFKVFLDAAHDRGLRVIIDFVMNHTSDSHPWFQSSRADPDGPYGNYYVWSDTDEAYSDARIIFCDTEDSNWSWDSQRKQFYWHRFFHHQPDLNFEEPRVMEEMLDAVRFWMDLGIDGFRLDAVPYLIEPRARTARTCQELTRSSSSCAPWSMKNTQAASCCVKLTSGLTTSSSILATVTNARWPSTFRSCHACTWDCVAVHGNALARSWLTLHTSRTAASGGPSCATTTNSPSKW
ncbi:trehalose synthase [Cutibacterium acnes JCM 18918]|nr:trehalose synthase [Cutibacterium acnes JCM 18918]